MAIWLPLIKYLMYVIFVTHNVIRNRHKNRSLFLSILFKSRNIYTQLRISCLDNWFGILYIKRYEISFILSLMTFR